MITSIISKINKARIKILSQFLTVNKNPIIILGNQKTGTTAITHLLADYGGLSKTVDIPELFSPEIERIISGEILLESFAQKHSYRFSRDVIKEPSLTFLFNQVQHIHPNAKYVFITRDPRSNIRSILNRLDLPGHIEALANNHFIHPQWKSIFDKNLWNLPNGNYIEILSHRWVKAAKVYEDNRSSMILVKYEDFNSDKLKTIVDLANDLDIGKVNDITNKLNIQYQQKGNPNVEWDEFFGVENLSRINKICGHNMERMGYSIE